MMDVLDAELMDSLDLLQKTVAGNFNENYSISIVTACDCTNTCWGDCGSECSNVAQ
jgi:hypothetical protein